MSLLNALRLFQQQVQGLDGVVDDSAAEQEDEQQTNHDERCDDGCKVMVVAQNVTFRTDNGQTPGGACWVWEL